MKMPDANAFWRLRPKARGGECCAGERGAMTSGDVKQTAAICRTRRRRRVQIRRQNRMAYKALLHHSDVRAGVVAIRFISAIYVSSAYTECISVSEFRLVSPKKGTRLHWHRYTTSV